MTNKINLYIFAESGHAAAYGIGSYVRELTISLKDSSINICVVHLYCENSEIIMEDADGISHWYVPLVALHRTKEYYRNVVYLLRLLIKDTNKLVFHLNLMRNYPLVNELRRAFSCKIIYAVHLFDWCFSLLGNLTHFRRILAKEAESPNLSGIKFDVENDYSNEKKALHCFDKIICLAEYTKVLLQTDYEVNSNRINLIFNGLEDNRKANNSKVLLREKFRIPVNAPVILFTGKIDKIKGVDYLIPAFRIVLKTFPDCRLLLVGSGTYDIYLKKCEDIWMNITFTGRVEKGTLLDLYSVADIGVLPSFHEQCSYSAIEMMMHGLPVIGSTTTGLKEMIVDGETGLHIPVIEHLDSVEIAIELFAEKILFLLQNSDERMRMGSNARRRYETKYSAEIFRQNMLQFYQSLF